MSRPKITMAVVATAVVTAAAGCSPAGGERGDDSSPRREIQHTARTYQEAVSAGEWRTMCRLSSERERRGTVEECAERQHDDSEPTEPPSGSPSPSDPSDRPSYADGSGVPPPETSTPQSGGRSSTGPVTTGRPARVPAAGEHAAGYGVLTSYTVYGDSPHRVRRAVRLVPEGGAWRVDQYEYLEAGQGRSAVREALGDH